MQVHHIEAIAAILVHIISLPNLFGEIFIEIDKRKVALEDDLGNLLKSPNKKNMLSTLRLVEHCV